jgi:ectoine hydroxylase-related dioxygenase (phytanoyl-CoA dioxygenase family)
MTTSTSEASERRDSFRKDGVVLLRGALDPAALAEAQRAYEWSLAHPSRGASTFPGSDGVFYQDLANRNAWPAYERLVRESRVADLVAELWGSPHVWFMYEQVFRKEGGKTRRTPWHQDTSYLPIDGERLAVVWISFDPVARENALEFVRGSHRGVLYDGSRFDEHDDTAPLYGDGTLPRLPDIERERARFDIVSFAVEPGDAVAFHPSMLHGGAPTPPGGRRRTLSLRFFGDDVRYAPRSGFSGMLPDEPTTYFEELPGLLQPGAPLRHPGFPKVRPRA